MLKLSYIALLLVLLVVPALAENYVDLVKKGNEALKNNDYKKALEYYHSAETDLPESPQLDYNIAGALYQQGGYEEAVDKYTKSLNALDVDMEQRAHYNLGNTYYRMGDYQKAIASYEKALNLNPDDRDAKFNLELSRRMLKEQIQPEQQNPDQQQQQQEQEKKDQPQQQQGQQDEQKQDQSQQDQQQQDQQQQQEDQQQQKPQSKEQKEMSKEDAERILNALRDDEQELQKDIKREVTASDYVGKDW